MARIRKTDNLILKAASLYYEHNLTQEQIAKKLGVSRPTVVRMLKQALEDGHVVIKMATRLPHYIELETEIEALLGEYGLGRVVVAEGIETDSRLTVAREAAFLLESQLKDGDVLGVGWSSTLMYVAQFLRKGKHSPQRVVQLGGYVGSTGNASAQEISVRMAEILHAPVASLPAPVLVGSSMLRDALMEDPAIKNTMQWVGKCNVGIVGIGVATTKSTLVTSGYLTKAEISEARDLGAIGDILSHYYTLEGQEIPTSWSDRMLSVDLESLRSIKNLIGVASGSDKARAVIGAVKCKILNTLVIDVSLAEAILKV
jgi:deoxyribonucleoside regulator